MLTEPQSDWGPSLCEDCFYDLTMVNALPPRHAPCPNCGSQGDDPAWDRFSDFLVPEACLPSIVACTKKEAVRPGKRLRFSVNVLPRMCGQRLPMESGCGATTSGVPGVAQVDGTPSGGWPSACVNEVGWTSAT